MSVSFGNKGTEDVFDGVDSKEARKICPSDIIAVARRKLDQLNGAISVNDMKIPPGNRLEALKGDRAGYYSIRINDQYRICFGWSEAGAIDVEIIDYHS